jgi:[acyl-carrier-protein] S-malonyltransferase
VVEPGKIAYVFPGQGAQKVGMGKDLNENSRAAAEVFQQADITLGFSLSRLCFEGPEEELRQTMNTQPAIVTTSFACLRAALSINNGKLPPPAFVAGHSLGEYTALAVAGVVDFPTAVYLVRERGRLMQEAGQRVEGGMAAILGMDEATLATICQESGTWMANINCPGQIVISGAKANIEKAISLAQERGASRAVPLQVSGAFHTPLMQPAVDGMTKIIAGIVFKDAVIPIIANTTAEPVTSADRIKAELLRQLTNSVQWQRSTEHIIRSGVTTLIEVGPGKVLSGLIKRINRDVKTLNVGDYSELKNIVG